MFKDDHLYFKNKSEAEKESILHEHRMKALSKLPPDVREAILRSSKTDSILREHGGKHRAFYDMGGAVNVGSSSNQQDGQQVQNDMNNQDAQTARNAQVQTTTTNSNNVAGNNQPPPTPVNPFGPPSGNTNGGQSSY